MAQYDTEKSRMLKVKEVADLLSMHRRTVIRLVQQGKLKGAKIGGSWRVSEADVASLLRGEKRD
jgi:excisionase family DNA binding protein